MAKVAFKSTHRKYLQRASREAIGDYFVNLPSHVRNKKWLQLNNPYRKSCVQTYADHLGAGAVQHEELVAYIAASSPTHAIDGWSFLGRAMQSLLRGDHYSAIHFGYYAELRAAMALLASEGVGIFQNRHPVVTSTTSTLNFPKVNFTIGAGSGRGQWASTHVIVVPCLRYWSSLKRAGDLLDQVVQPGGIAFSTWLDQLGAPTRARAVGSSWLRAWGLDLAQMETDHNARNVVSYRPSALRQPVATNAEKIATFVRDLWSLFEPSSNLRFPNLETQLLRLALRDCQVGPDVNRIRSLGYTDVEAETWYASLSQGAVPVPLLDARIVSPIESARCPIQVLSRASLLLFIATRAAGLHLADAGYSREELGFWWRQFGADRGLWNAGSAPDDPRDIWADVRDALNDIDDVLAGDNVVGLSGWRATMGRALDDFGAWELVAIWGLVP